jgi:cell wall-associated NlpC family hydrolase
LGQQEDGLSEQYDFGVQKLAQAQARVESATRAFQQAKQEQAKTIALLQLDAVQAYVGGGPEVALSTPAPVQSVDQALLRQELEQTFAADQTSALDGYQLAEADASTARVRLIAARQADSLQLSRLGRERRQVQAAQDKLIALEQQVKGRIAALVAEIQRQQILAEQRAEAARLARLRAEEAAAAAAQAARARREAALEAAAATPTTTTVAPAATTTTVAPAATTTTVAPATTTTAVPPTTAVAQSTTAAGATPVPGQSPAAAIAVQAALSRVGDPYVWGAAGPSAFDCSGLVMWAYAQAGVYLPHYSGSQYADTIHIPMSDLQPGDLVFPANPGQHVAMYIGNGEIVQAPYTGADVQVVPLTSFFVLASQVG